IVKSPTYVTNCDNIGKYGMVYCDKFIEYYNKADYVKLECRIDSNFVAEVQKIMVKNGSGKRIGYYMPLALLSYADQNAHPTFSNMFIVTEFLQDHNALIATRNVRDGERAIYVGMVVRGLLNVDFDTNIRNVIGRGRTAKNPQFLAKNLKNDISFGEILTPCFAFSGDLLGDSAEVVTIVADSREELLSKIERLPKEYSEFVSEMSEVVALPELTNRLLHPLINIAYDNEKLLQICEGGEAEIKRFFDITRSKKLILYKFEGERSFGAFRKLCDALSYLSSFHCEFRLIVANLNSSDVSCSSIDEVLFSYNLMEYARVFAGEAAVGLEKYAFIVFDSGLNLTFDYKINTNPRKKGVNMSINEEFIQEFSLKCGYGGFVGDRYVLPLNVQTGLPYCNVICGKKGGFVASSRGGGMQYLYNSHENRVTRCDNESISDRIYEKICVEEDGKLYRVNGGEGVTHNVIFDDGSVVFKSKTPKCSVVIDEYCILNGGIKVFKVAIKNPKLAHIILHYNVSLALSSENNAPFIASKQTERGRVKVVNLANNMSVGISVNGDINTSEIWAKNNLVSVQCMVSQQSTADVFVCIGDNIDIINLDYLKIAEKHYKPTKIDLDYSNIQLKSEQKSVDLMFNKWSIMQIVNARLNGKCGYYQQGGAIGFRDQLQDVMVLLHHNSKAVKEHILLCCAHQYEDGDVMHWWHPPQFGLRTRITDDKLFLVQAVYEYVVTTGDYSFLQEKVAFLTSPPLSEGELSRYECANVSNEAVSVHEHCKRALKSALVYGEHNLLIMGTGDWNDGMDAVGKLGKGESVMVSMLFVITSENFAKICDKSIKNDLISRAEALHEAINNFAYDGSHYMRVYGDNGVWYGGGGSKSLEIDLISQAYAVFSNIGSIERLESSLKSAYSLVDKEAKIIKLLAPPLDKSTYLGYISAYPKGVRENGGQYTHAAMWYILALFKLNFVEDAYDLLKMINPIERCLSQQGTETYMGEPFVWSGDVYSGTHAGRCGWTWYTGGAAWFYRVVLEGIFGIKKRGDKLYINPHLPIALNGAILQYGSCKITYKIAQISKIIVDNNKKQHSNFVLLDDKPHEIVAQCKASTKRI
ncbi:MAG: hypothetical protein R3Y23_03950, partial [Bacillota bacterium]